MNGLTLKREQRVELPHSESAAADCVSATTHRRFVP